MARALIIGGGHAGGSVSVLLRQYGFEGEIILAGSEATAPYQRPPLSKAWLKGETDLESLLLRPADFYADQAIDLRTGVTAQAIDAVAKTVTFADGACEAYDVLILATGSTARKLSIPGADRSHLIELRSVQDAERLKAALGPGRKLVVVGGGYVGLEAAASARRLGADVVVIERMTRVLQRVASEPLSAFFTDLHRANGVKLLADAEVTGFEDDGVRLADGSIVEADAILVGVGAFACDALARTAGLTCENGVVVNAFAQTSDASIYAIGDVTQRPIPAMSGHVMRLESVPNALEQAKQAASDITGRPPPVPEVPWFWSDQYDVKLQIAGLPLDVDRQIVRGSPADGRFAVFHLKNNIIVCVEAVNAAPEFMVGRQLIGRKTIVDPLALADASTSMKLVTAQPGVSA